MKNTEHLPQSFYKTFPALVLFLAVCGVIAPQPARAQQNSTVAKITAAKQADAFGEKFSEGRNLIDKGEWERAAKAFSEALEKDPQNDSADAALYWLAFCFKKQNKYKEALAVLERLLKEFPNSAWVGDAQVMKMEIPPRLVAATTLKGKMVQERVSADLQAQIITGKVNNAGQTTTVAGVLETTERLPLSRADEIKIAAFRSLLNADPKRAIETMGEVLKPDSKASETLKQAILRVWRNPRIFAAQTLTTNIAKNVGDKEFVALLRETLVRSFQSETNPKIRREIIYALAGVGGEQTIDYLRKLYKEESDREVKKAIINAFGSAGNMLAGINIGLTMRKPEVDIVREEVRRKNLPLGERKDELDALLEIIRGEKDLELRRLAFSNLERFSGWTTTDQSVETIKSLYDAETDEEFKTTLIGALAESGQTSAVRKLLDIARNDKSDKLRLEAIHSLRNSKDPEVLKFLEDLIK